MRHVDFFCSDKKEVQSDPLMIDRGWGENNFYASMKNYTIFLNNLFE